MDLIPENIGPPDPPKLYSPKQIVGAAFLGTPIAGGIVMAENFRALGNDARAKATIQVSIALTVTVFVLAFYLPERTPTSLLPAAYCGLFLWYANKYQLKPFERHMAAGGPQQSNWRVFGIGVGCLVGVLVVLVVLIVMFPNWFPE